MPGRVWYKRKAEFLKDISKKPHKIFYRDEYTKTYGLNSAVGFPVIFENKVICIFVFFTSQLVKEDKEFIELLTTISPELSPYILSKIQKYRILKIARLLKLLSECNQILIKTSKIDTLLNKICKIIVQIGAYEFAWIGFINKKNKLIHPVSWYGKSEKYTKYAKNTYLNEKSTITTAIHTLKPIVYKHRWTHPYYSFESKKAIPADYYSSAALPLISGKKILGVLNVYSEKLHSFDKEEIKILTELSTDIAYGIEAIRAKEEKEKLLEEKEKNVRPTSSKSKNGSTW